MVIIKLGFAACVVACVTASFAACVIACVTPGFTICFFILYLQVEKSETLRVSVHEKE